MSSANPSTTQSVMATSVQAVGREERTPSHSQEDNISRRRSTSPSTYLLRTGKGLSRLLLGQPGANVVARFSSSTPERTSRTSSSLTSSSAADTVDRSKDKNESGSCLQLVDISKDTSSSDEEDKSLDVVVLEAFGCHSQSSPVKVSRPIPLSCEESIVPELLQKYASVEKDLVSNNEVEKVADTESCTRGCRVEGAGKSEDWMMMSNVPGVVTGTLKPIKCPSGHKALKIYHRRLIMLDRQDKLTR
jgi:hypothetical protein